MKVLNIEKMKQILVSNWTQIIDGKSLFKICLDQIRNETYAHQKSNELIFDTKTRFSVTNVSITDEPFEFIVWAEFCVPKDQGFVIGTKIFSVGLDGESNLKESYGTHFL